MVRMITGRHASYRNFGKRNSNNGICTWNSKQPAAQFGQLAVVRIMQKFQAWNVAAELSFVAMRPVLARGPIRGE